MDRDRLGEEERRCEVRESIARVHSNQEHACSSPRYGRENGACSQKAVAPIAIAKQQAFHQMSA